MSHEMDRVVRPPPWRTRRGRMVIGVAAAILLSLLTVFAFVSPARRSVRLPLAQVSIDQVQPGVYHDFTTLQGAVQPRDIIYLDALEGGQVQKVLVHAGARITAGPPLVVFRNTQLQLDVLSQEGRLV